MARRVPSGRSSRRVVGASPPNFRRLWPGRARSAGRWEVLGQPTAMHDQTVPYGVCGASCVDCAHAHVQRERYYMIEDTVLGLAMAA